MGSNRNERSVVSIAGAWRFVESWASGILFAPALPLGFHWCAPPGLFVNSHSYLKRFSKKSLLHFVGVVVHVTSSPLVIASPAMPEAYAFVQPRPCSSIGEPSGSVPTCLLGAAP